jgi:hypothetical protein
VRFSPSARIVDFPEGDILSLPEAVVAPLARLDDRELKKFLAAWQADKLGPRCIALFFEPVGIHQTRRIIVGNFDEGLEKRFLLLHRLLSSEPTYRLPNTRSIAQQPRTCSPGWRQ